MMGQGRSAGAPSALSLEVLHPHLVRRLAAAVGPGFGYGQVRPLHPVTSGSRLWIRWCGSS